MRKGLKSALGILTVLVLAAACASLRGTQGGFLDTRYTAEELDLPDAEKEDIVVCNVDPRNPGAAYLVTDRREVYALIPEETTWRYTPIARLASARPRIICGDAWPGNGSLPELYISDGRRLVMLAWTSAGWLDPQLLYESAARIPEKAAVGDVDPRTPGSEVYFSADQPRQAFWEGRAWKVALLPGPPGYVAAGDADRTVTGAELYVSGAGATDQIRYDGGWQRQRIAAVGTGQPQNAIVVGDADPTNPGNEVVLNWHETNVRGRLWVLARTRTGWVSQLVFAAGEGTPWSLHHFHNLAIGDFDAAHPGPEIVMTWSPSTHNPGRISVFAKTGNRWEHHLIWQDLDEAHGIAFLTLVPQGKPALIAVGHPREGVLLRIR